MPSKRSMIWVAGLMLAAGAGCDYYAKPNRALPASFSVKTLEGRQLTPGAMRGRPWVINVWLPG